MMLKLLVKNKDSCQTGVLVPVPSYSSFNLAVVNEGLVMVPYHLCEEQGWTLQVEELRRAFTEGKTTCNPKALYICNPGNPTGNRLSRTDLYYCKEDITFMFHILPSNILFSMALKV